MKPSDTLSQTVEPSEGAVASASRRSFIRGTLALGVAASSGLPLSGCGGADAGEISSGLFRHGVASGDPLSDRVIVEDYAAKIKNKAVRFEAWQECQLVGFAAAYCDDSTENVAFLTQALESQGAVRFGPRIDHSEQREDRLPANANADAFSRIQSPPR